MSKEQELIQTLEEYIKLLGKEHDATFMIAYHRGYRCEPEDIQLGNELRKKIKQLKSEL